LRGLRLLGAAAAVAVIAAWLALRPAASTGWREIAWPFPRDAWPAGLAFDCPHASCGADVQLFIRPKRGFCANCDTGVTSDAEVDGVSDVDMIAADFTPVEAGSPLAVGDLAGRQRAYTLLLPHGRRSPALGMAMTRRKQCDLVVAVATGATSARARTAIGALLASERVTTWIGQQLDGR
jgi:hypothetical protein